MKAVNNNEPFRLGKNLRAVTGKEIEENVFHDFNAAGIKNMEISLIPINHTPVPWEKISEWAKKYSITLWSFHLPFDGLDLTDLNEEIRLENVRKHTEYIKKAAQIGVKVIVVHPSAEPYTEEERELRIEKSKKSLKALVEIADNEGVILAVENLPRTCLGRNSKEILEILSIDERLRACFDTNHLLGQPLCEFIREVGDKIVTTHISDYDFKDERHWLPGEGDINWTEVIAALYDVGYTGPIMYEIRMDTPNTIQRRALTYEDFVINHTYLMKGEMPPALGKPIKENCPHWTKRVEE